MRDEQIFNNPLLPPLRECDHLRGSLDKPITLMVYGDYQCSTSAQFHAKANAVYQSFNDQLCLIYRHSPGTPPSTPAWKAAEAAEAASAQGKFWEMHDILYQHHQTLEDSNLVEYAEQVGLDIPQFLNGLANHTYTQKVLVDIDSGKVNGITTTPAFFVGVRSENIQDLDTLLHNILEVTEANNSRLNSSD